MFWRPSYLEVSSWLEHIPFAFWIIEASQPKVFVELGVDYGASYFAHCQAVDKLGLDTQCYAIDPWVGDDKTTTHDNNIFEKVNAYNESQYSGFSHLVRSNYDHAARNFSDGTIDLLHINGLHPQGFSDRNFEAWLPKLSEHALVLLHGTNARERDFDVLKLYDHLQTQYPTFEFSYGHGLSLIGIGNDQNDMVQLLLKASKNERAKQAIHEVFFRLGRACADSFAVNKNKESIQKLNEEVGKHQNQLLEVRRAFETAQTELDRRTGELNDVRNILGSQTEHHAIERGQLSEKITLLQEIRADLKKDVERLQGRIDSTSAELYRRIEEMSRLEQSNSAHRQQIDAIANQLQAKEATVNSLQAELTERTNALAALQSMKQTLAEENLKLGEAKAALTQQVVGHQQQISALQTEAAQKQASLDALQAEGIQKQAMLDSLQAELTERANALATLQNMKQTLAEENLKLGEERAALTQQVVGHQQQISALQADGAQKQSLLDAQQTELARLLSTLAELQHVKQTLAGENLKLVKEKSGLNQQVAAHQQHISALKAEAAQRTSALEELQLMKQALADENLKLGEEKAGLAQQAAVHQQLIGSLQDEAAQKQNLLDVQQAELAQRAGALAELQHMKQTLADENLMLGEERTALKNENVDHQQTIAALKEQLSIRETAVADLQKEQQSLTGNVADRFRELAELTQRLQVSEQSNTQLQADLNSEKAVLAKENIDHQQTIAALREQLSIRETAVADLQKEEQALARNVADRFRELAELTRWMQVSEQSKSQLQDDLDSERGANEKLNRSLAERFKELSSMTSLLMDKEQMLEQKRRQLMTLRNEMVKSRQSTAWPISQNFHFPFGRPDKYREQKEKILLSGLFDTEWYLKHYPDVVKAKYDPIEHYIRFGAAENRDPGPAFSTSFYRALKRDDLAPGENPLLHFLANEEQNWTVNNQEG
ncbi:MAG: class I SAM-dependent methyltransferase [Nitrosomonadales bacterium]|nr:class I SAM-dependent methyltransferase [Nitrosomonadales bacterium]